MDVKKIFFDMDGVLANFNKGVVDLCHIEAMDQNHHTPEYDDLMFEKMRHIEHFYEKLEVNSDAADLFRKLYSQYGNKIEILSGIPKPERGILTAGEDKINWMKRMFPEIDVNVNIVLRKEKVKFCTGPDCILIDDFVKNIQEWEKCGGIGILYKDADSTWKKLEKLLNAY